jgi:hypothetical protein
MPVLYPDFFTTDAMVSSFGFSAILAQGMKAPEIPSLLG